MRTLITHTQSSLFDRYFKANNSYNNFCCCCTGWCFKLLVFLHPQVPQPQQIDGFLYKALLKWLAAGGTGLPVIYPAIASVLLFTQAITFQQIGE